jgi:hypothetical protein
VCDEGSEVPIRWVRLVAGPSRGGVWGRFEVELWVSMLFYFAGTEAKAWEPAQHSRGKFRWVRILPKKREVRYVRCGLQQQNRFFTPLWLEVVSGAVSFFFSWCWRAKKEWAVGGVGGRGQKLGPGAQSTQSKRRRKKWEGYLPMRADEHDNRDTFADAETTSDVNGRNVCKKTQSKSGHALVGVIDEEEKRGKEIKRGRKIKDKKRTREERR